MRRIASASVTALLCALLVFAARSTSTARNGDARSERIAWVARCMKQIQTVQPGMKRKEMEKVLTTEGGLYSPTTGHYVSRECPYFKVDVEFAAKRGKDGRMFSGAEDKITKVSRPYMEWEIDD